MLNLNVSYLIRTTPYLAQAGVLWLVSVVEIDSRNTLRVRRKLKIREQHADETFVIIRRIVCLSYFALELHVGVL